MERGYAEVGLLTLQWCEKKMMTRVWTMDELEAELTQQLASVVFASLAASLGLHGGYLDTQLPEEDCGIRCVALRIPVRTRHMSTNTLVYYCISIYSLRGAEDTCARQVGLI